MRDENGREVTTVQMEAGEVRTFYVEVDDYYNDNILDNDYNYVYPDNITYGSEITNTSAIAVSDTVPYGVIHNVGDILPRRVSTLRVTALNPGGNQDSNYNDMYANLAWVLTYTPMQQTAETQTISILVTARDDATGDYEDGGGTCNAAGLGSLGLLLSLAFVLKRK
jgi:hypothetical protein